MAIPSVTYCVATNSDIRRLPRLLTQFPEHVLVRDAFGGCFQLTSLVHGPFWTRQEGGYWILVGTRISDEKVACLRIIEYRGLSVVQWKQSLAEAWHFDAHWVPVQQLYVPNTVLVSAL